jgi:hypothetical protein
MTVDTEGFERAHANIRRHADDLRETAERFPELPPEGRAETLDRILGYLHAQIVPHMKLDERLLYPEAALRLGDALVASAMNYDHLAIRRWIDDLEATDAADTATVQRLLYGLDALIRVHLWKEDELFLGPIRSPSWPA